MHYYHDYLEQCYNTIEKLSTDLHNIYIRRNNLANICYANLNLLESNGITKEIIDDLILGKRVKGVKLLRKLNWSDEALFVLRSIVLFIYLLFVFLNFLLLLDITIGCVVFLIRYLIKYKEVLISL